MRATKVLSEFKGIEWPFYSCDKSLPAPGREETGESLRGLEDSREKKGEQNGRHLVVARVAWGILQRRSLGGENSLEKSLEKISKTAC